MSIPTPSSTNFLNMPHPPRAFLPYRFFLLFFVFYFFFTRISTGSSVKGWKSKYDSFVEMPHTNQIYSSWYENKKNENAKFEHIYYSDPSESKILLCEPLEVQLTIPFVSIIFFFFIFNVLINCVRLFHQKPHAFQILLVVFMIQVPLLKFLVEANHKKTEIISDLDLNPLVIIIQEGH
jgi:hypothetical protein